MLKNISNIGNLIVSAFGFETKKQYMDSVFLWQHKTIILSVGTALGMVCAFMEDYLGVIPVLFTSFIFLLGWEFYTGIKKSRKNGEKISSKKWDRILLKLIGYMIVLFALNSLGKQYADLVFNVGFYAHHVALGHIIVGLCISIIENHAALDDKKENRLVQLLKKILDKYIELK